jgi:hypothetical protein
VEHLDYNISRRFILENKDTIICEPSGRTYTTLLSEMEKPILAQMKKEEEDVEKVVEDIEKEVLSIMYDKIDKK